ncbi:unnamed protein product [Spirodela intermedia]|uniref:Uncharacterized protein n=1 Tax=Spirodela intermedia TaxID=51605 RepID=A0A7I8JQT8_SPIIN|nr:unnamed protein product [Spirodela intermedia]CAA6672518.1 unnamed protein product [Spirodela intermedia]
MAAEGRKKHAVRLNRSCILIIVVASVERFAYKGVASNMVTYLTDVVHLGTSEAAKTVNNWCGVTSMLPLLGAFLADSYWDRHSTILGSSFLYVTGLAALTAWAVLHSHMPSSSLFFPLYLISIGQGGYNPSLQAFGADQLEKEKSPPEEEEKSLFFQWWYFGICSGSLLGNSLMSYVQDTYGWELGFAIPAAVMLLSVAVFAAGARFCVRRDVADGSSRPIDDIFRGLKQALTKKLATREVKLPAREDDDVELEKGQKGEPEQAASSPTPEKKAGAGEHPTPWAGEVILRLLPIWAMLLMFAVIFQLPSTFFTRQGSITVSIILLMPLYDKLIIPCFRFLTRREEGINVMERIGVGMLLSILAMTVAALVEGRRIRAAAASDRLCIFWLLPQYEFFYASVPSGMRTIGIGLYLSVFGVGSFLSSALIWAIEEVTSAGGTTPGWFSDDIKDAHLDRFYWFLSLLSTASFLLFVILCKTRRDTTT